MSLEYVQKCYSYVKKFTFIHKKKELLTPTESGNFKIVFQDSDSLTIS